MSTRERKMCIQRCPFGNPTTIRIEKSAVDWTERRCKSKLIGPGWSFICEVNAQTNSQTPVFPLFFWQHHYNNSFSFLLSYKNSTCKSTCDVLNLVKAFFPSSSSFFLNRSNCLFTVGSWPTCVPAGFQP